MENFPSALVIASYESVCHDNNTLYRLVRPIPGGVGVQSTDRLVNVVPFRRKYTFERKEQLNEFIQQMLRRPLVLQPVLHFGRGLGYNCALCYQDELWLVMVNQTHPKILSRLQMGFDSAKRALEKGQPFELRFRFGKLIQRVYREHLHQKERGEAQKSNSVLHEYLSYFRYAEWEHCDLHLRYHGYGAYLNRSSALHSLPNLEMKWEFEDIGMHEMEWRQFNNQVYPRPHLSPVFEDEIREHLPGWTINSVSPLDYIGDSIPEQNYDYAQAGRLYSSFRKKRRPRNNQRLGAYDADYENERIGESDSRENDEGAFGYGPSVYPEFVETHQDAFEHDFDYDDAEKPKFPSRSRHNYNKDFSHSSYSQHQGFHENLDYQSPSNFDHDTSRFATRPESTNSTSYAKSQSLKQQKFGSEPQPDKYIHINANVTVISNAPSKDYKLQRHNSSDAHNVEPPAGLYNALNPSSSDYHTYADPFKKQDSDRFSRSTNADSGYCPDGDEEPSRNGTYDYIQQSYAPRTKLEHTHLSYKDDIRDHEGLENPAFRHDYGDGSSKWQSRKQFEAKSMTWSSSEFDHISNASSGQQNSKYALSPKDSVGDVMKAPPRQKRLASGSNTVTQVTESFI